MLVRWSSGARLSALRSRAFAGRSGVYWHISRRSFRRWTTYRAATFAGVVTNSLFGFFRGYVLLALYRQRSTIAGFDAAEALTYTFATQGFFAVVASSSIGELAERIRTGDVATDLYLPLDVQAYWAAQDAGRTTFLAIFRGIPPYVIGAIAFSLRTPVDPTHWVAFTIVAVGGLALAFAWRFLVSLIAFWLLDGRGASQLSLVVVMFFSGLVVPVAFLPDWLRAVAWFLPFGGMVDLPVEVFLGRHTGAAALAAVVARQLVWIAALVAIGRLVLARALRNVVVHGG